MTSRRRPAVRIVAAGLAIALAFPSAAAACTVEEYMTAEDIASGRYDVTPPDTYGGGPAGPHTHGEVAAPPADPAAAGPGNAPAATAAPTATAPIVNKTPVSKPSVATGTDQTEAQPSTSPSRREAPAVQGDPGEQDPAPAAAKPRRSKPAAPPRAAVPAPSRTAPAQVTDAPVAAVAPASPAVESVASPTSRPAATRAGQATAARSAAATRPQPRRERSAANERLAPVPLPTNVAQHRARSTEAAQSGVVTAPPAEVKGPTDDGGPVSTTFVVGIVGLLGAALLLLSRRRRSHVTATMPTAPLDDDVEAELQELLAEHGSPKGEAAEGTERRSAV